MLYKGPEIEINILIMLVGESLDSWDFSVMMVVTTGTMESRTFATHVGNQRSSRADYGKATAGSILHMPIRKASNIKYPLLHEFCDLS